MRDKKCKTPECEPSINRVGDELGRAEPRMGVPDRPLTPAQLASYLQISRRTLARHVHAGRIPYFKIGNRIRFVPSDVLRQLRITPVIKKE